MPTPAVRNLIREGKTHQIYSVLQTGSAVGHADDGHLARGARARRARSPRSSPKPARTTPEELRRLLGAPSLAAA